MNISNPDIRLMKDETLGNQIPLPAKISRMMDNTIASLSLPPSESGERAEFKVGFKANLVELLAAIKLLRRHSGSLQKAQAPRGHKVDTVSLEDLKKSVNGRSGVSEHGVLPFLSGIVKGVFNELTKPNSLCMPGQWIYSLKQTNKVQSNIGVMYKLGYESKVANVQKVLKVIKTSVRVKPEKESDKGKEKKKDQKISSTTLETYTKDSKTEPSGINHAEFRLGVSMLLPLIDPRDKQGPKSNISRDILSVRNHSVLEYYSNSRNVVDAINLAYATQSSLGKKGSKATILGYRGARGHAIRLSSKCDFMDWNGKRYSKFSEVPEHIRNFLLKLLNRKLVSNDDEDPGSGNDDAMEVEQEQPPPVSLPEKKTKHTKDSSAVSGNTRVALSKGKRKASESTAKPLVPKKVS